MPGGMMFEYERPVAELADALDALCPGHPWLRVERRREGPVAKRVAEHDRVERRLILTHGTAVLEHFPEPATRPGARVSYEIDFTVRRHLELGEQRFDSVEELAREVVSYLEGDELPPRGFS